MTKDNDNKLETPRTFRGNPEYTEEFEKAVDKLIAAEIDDRQERIDAVDRLCEEYTESVGETPDSRQLYRLTNEILREELTDKRKNKVRAEEYPFLSKHQLKRRFDNEFPAKEVKGEKDEVITGTKKVSIVGDDGDIQGRKRNIYKFKL